MILPGLAPLADRYDGLILDLWGVLHDGIQAYPGVIDCLQQLRRQGKPVCLLSNAPRRNASVVTKLERMGIGRDLYDHLLTSGEAAHRALIDPPDAWHAALGRRCLHIGPDRDLDLFDGAPVMRVDQVAQADFVLNTGPLRYEDRLEDYEALLRQCAAAGLPMLCANPDLVVMVGTVMVVCAGSLAARYEELGGSVRYHGKPHAPVYARCFALLGIADPGRVLAVGDSFRTDITGARAAGCGALLITGGIHRQDLAEAWGHSPDPARLAALSARYGVAPDAAIATFAW